MPWRDPILMALAAAAGLGGIAAAQCTSYDFDEYAEGTVITSQLDGVTFSAIPGSCGGPGSVLPHIVEPWDGTSSGSKALGLQQGCPEFSPDFLRMVFDYPQRHVKFTLGDQASPGITFQVRAYRENGTIITPSQTVVTGSGVYHLVHVIAPSEASLIKRIEVENFYDLFETIDDLEFNKDITPPEARIDSPLHGGCLCQGDGPVTFTGVCCDEDGEYDRDRLEYRAVGAEPGTPWTLIQEYVGSPVCEPGNLYTWNLNDVPHGWYYVRMTVINACGLASTDIVHLFVDKAYGTTDIQEPANGATVCGEVVIKGTANDSCGRCGDYYAVGYGPTPNGPFYYVDPDQTQYTELVINGELARWDTTALGLDDGTYYIRLAGHDVCGNFDYDQIMVVLDSSVCGCEGDLNGDGQVDVTDLLVVLAAWGACP